MKVGEKMSKLITLEGIEGVGKSSALAAIKNTFDAHHIDCVMTREPGGTPLAESLRSLLLTEQQEKIEADTELLMLYAGRVQHWHRIIAPALKAGKWVVSDRFYDATFAYQGGGRQIEDQRIQALHDWAFKDISPDCTLLLDAPVEIGLARIKDRESSDRFEKETLPFFNRVRDYYLKLANNHSRFKVIDASQPQSVVISQVTDVITRLITA